MRKDGDYVHKGLKSGKVSRNAHKIVVAERVVLNFVQRMSGIATLTKILFYINGRCCYPARILETKKTATGLRLPKVLIGAAGGIVNAIKSVDAHLKQKNLEMDVKVETRTLEEVKEVLEYVSGSKTRLTRIMLDNMVVYR
ncbi:BnaA06g34980D [Brassica napus]|uniref:BnaA06g34980D protein n=1 Tax=Brassica napus TaxID=3708 RepID=A0A078FX15_BRANA|nr:BnaA06g34980D [Brassica napus]